MAGVKAVVTGKVPDTTPPELYEHRSTRGKPAKRLTYVQAQDAAIDALPPTYRDQLDSVAIVVEQEAAPEQLASVGARGCSRSVRSSIIPSPT